MEKPQIYIGTSGWSYKGWHDILYPKEVKKDFLKFYSTKYNSVEINSTFYRMQPKNFFEKWASETPEDFQFAVKLNRLFTHTLRLKMTGQTSSLRYFISNAAKLAKKWGVLLVQLPPSLKFDEKVVAKFFEKLQAEMKKNKLSKVRLALEPRHKTWMEEAGAKATVKLAKKYKFAIVFGQSSKYASFMPDDSLITLNFVYVRFHGPREFASSEYGEEGLSPWVELIKKWLKKKLDVYIYFNNDVHGYAIKDSELLKQLLA